MVILDDDKVLLMKYNYGGNEVYALPGGNPDPGETLEDTLVRELNEELNLSITVSKLLLIGEVIFAEKSKSTLHCIFLGSILSGQPNINPDHTTSLGFEWVNISSAEVINMYPNVGKHFRYLTGQTSGAETVYIGRIQQNWF